MKTRANEQGVRDGGWMLEIRERNLPNPYCFFTDMRYTGEDKSRYDYDFRLTLYDKNII